jgi:hypothetical protein
MQNPHVRRTSAIKHRLINQKLEFRIERKGIFGSERER